MVSATSSFSTRPSRKDIFLFRYCITFSSWVAKMKAVRQVLPAYDNELMEDRVFVESGQGDSLEVFIGKSGGEFAGAA